MSKLVPLPWMLETSYGITVGNIQVAIPFSSKSQNIFTRLHGSAPNKLLSYKTQARLGNRQNNVCTVSIFEQLQQKRI
jgi:hypothetical protein